MAICAAATLTTATELRAQAAAEKTSDDKCLSAPKGAGPAGSHWFYRIDHATKRQCWYLKEAGDKVARPKPQEAAPAAAKPSAQQPLTITQKSIANARAEWLSQQAEPKAAGAVTAPDDQDGKRSVGTSVLAPTPLATRWPDTSIASPAPNPADVSAAVADASVSQPPDVEQARPPVAPALAAVAAEPAKPTASLQMLLLVIAAALAMAGITVSLVFRIGRARARRAMRRKREAMWEPVPTRHPAPPTRAVRELPSMRRSEDQRAPRPRPSEDREQQVTNMLARLARSAQT